MTPSPPIIVPLERITDACNRLSFVRWDRLAVADAGDHDQIVSVYGWIDKGLAYRSDFVVLQFASWDDGIGTLTSSDEWSSVINERLNGTDSDHYDCQRVEHVLPDVEAAIKLDGPKTPPVRVHPPPEELGR